MSTRLNAASRLRTEVKAKPNFSYDVEDFVKDMEGLGFTAEESTGHGGTNTVHTFLPGPSIKKSVKGKVLLIQEDGEVAPHFSFDMAINKNGSRVRTYRVGHKLRADLPGFLAQVKTALKD